MVVGSKVLVGSSKVEGVVVEIEETTGSVLVAHQVMVDGKRNNIKQWYNQNTVIETEMNIDKTEVEKKINVSKKFKIREDKYSTKAIDAERKSGKTLAKALKELTEVTEMPADKHIEFGVLPQKSDSDGE
jgi:hypothetical protein